MLIFPLLNDYLFASMKLFMSDHLTVLFVSLVVNYLHVVFVLFKMQFQPINHCHFFDLRKVTMVKCLLYHYNAELNPEKIVWERENY